MTAGLIITICTCFLLSPEALYSCHDEFDMNQYIATNMITAITTTTTITTTPTIAIPLSSFIFKEAVNKYSITNDSMITVNISPYQITSYTK